MVFSPILGFVKDRRPQRIDCEKNLILFMLQILLFHSMVS